MSNKMKLNKTNIEGLEFAKDNKPYYVWDTVLPCFGIKVNKKKKSYIVQTRILGKEKRFSVGAFNLISPDIARKKAISILAQAKDGKSFEDGLKIKQNEKLTLLEVFEDYMNSKTLADKTLNDYTRLMNNTFSDWQNLPIINIDRNMVEDLFREKSKTAPACANYSFRMLRALFNFAMERYTVNNVSVIKSNPCKILNTLKIWNRIERRDTFITERELPLFLNAIKENKEDDIYVKNIKRHAMFVLLTGLREQEGACLLWDDIDFNEGIIKIEKTKNHYSHKFPLGKRTIKFLKDIYKVQSPKNKYVFLNTKGNHLQFSVTKFREIVFASANISFSYHDLRRTFTSILDHKIQDTVSIYTIKRLLNHKINSMDVTAGYIKYDVEDLRKPIQDVEDYIFSFISK